MTTSERQACGSEVLFWSRPDGKGGRHVRAECAALGGQGDCGYKETLEGSGDASGPDWWVMSDQVLQCMINHYEHALQRRGAADVS
jgi:hypothetical protein